jgi:sarcosine oxidase subunit gamma
MTRKESGNVPDQMQRKHALASFLNGNSVPDSGASGMRLEVRPHYGYLNLRGDPHDERFLQAVQQMLGHSLPCVPNTFTSADHTVFWLGPDEWLLSTALGREKEIAGQLAKNLAGQCYSLVDVTGGQLLIRLSGEHVRGVLAKGCTLDLHPRIFKVGQCAQTTLAKTSMLIALIDDTPTFDIVLRRSFAEYAARWLQHSGACIHFHNS